jgi:hypothetical protein
MICWANSLFNTLQLQLNWRESTIGVLGSQNQLATEAIDIIPGRKQLEFPSKISAVASRPMRSSRVL